MKLNWENVCKIRLTKKQGDIHPGGRLGFYDGVADYKMLKFYVEFDFCIWCNKEAIKTERARYCYCDPNCKSLHTEWKFQWRRLAKQNKRRNDPNKRPIGRRTWHERKMLNIKDFTLRVLLYQSKSRANKNKMNFDLDIDWIKDRAEKCDVTDIDFTYTMETYDPFAPSIDRTDCSGGYTKDNCKLVIWAYNVGKSEFTEEDMYQMAKSYVEFHDI